MESLEFALTIISMMSEIEMARVTKELVRKIGFWKVVNQIIKWLDEGLLKKEVVHKILLSAYEVYRPKVYNGEFPCTEMFRRLNSYDISCELSSIAGMFRRAGFFEESFWILRDVEHRHSELGKSELRQLLRYYAYATNDERSTVVDKYLMSEVTEIVIFAKNFITTKRDVNSHKTIIAQVKSRFARIGSDPNQYLSVIYQMIIEENMRRYEEINDRKAWWVKKRCAEVIADMYQRMGDELGMKKWKIYALEEVIDQ